MKKFVILGSLFSLFVLTILQIGVHQEVSVDVFKHAERRMIKEGDQTLRILNWEDYIYLNDPLNGYFEEDMVEQFKEYAKDYGYSNVEIVYSTTDTVETMLNELETGKAHYDLICPSDYGIQKLMQNDMLVDLRSLMNEYNLHNYDNYVSRKIQSYIEGLTATNDPTKKVSQYAYGYMWGTLGLLFNPEYDLYKKNEISPEKVITDMMDYDILWTEEYNGSISLKDSIRDTYFVGLAKAKKDELMDCISKYENNLISGEEYNAMINVMLNDASDEAIALVKEELVNVKKNIFGLEVDSGKQDIVKGTIGINLAWSGDSVYSMSLADEYNEKIGLDVDYGICYSLPKTGANIWFDGWCMPKDNRSEAQKHLACLFIDFMSDPVNASKNTDYIGYSPFIAGDAVLDLMRDWYDIRTELIYFYDDSDERKYQSDSDRYLSLYYIDPYTNEETEVWYDDIHDKLDNDPAYDNVNLYYKLDDNNVNLIIDDENMTYNSYLVIDFNEYEKVDLSYFFNDTLDEYENDIDTIFYSDCYLPFSYIDENGNEQQNTCVGRQFFAQFPSEETMYRCVMMRDFGDQNSKVRIMWEDFKANTLEPWQFIVFFSIVGVLLTAFIFNSVEKYIKKKNRALRLREKTKLKS